MIFCLCFPCYPCSLLPVSDLLLFVFWVLFSLSPGRCFLSIKLVFFAFSIFARSMNQEWAAQFEYFTFSAFDRYNFSICFRRALTGKGLMHIFDLMIIFGTKDYH